MLLVTVIDATRAVVCLCMRRKPGESNRSVDADKTRLAELNALLQERHRPRGSNATASRAVVPCRQNQSGKVRQPVRDTTTVFALVNHNNHRHGHQVRGTMRVLQERLDHGILFTGLWLAASSAKSSKVRCCPSRGHQLIDRSVHSSGFHQGKYPASSWWRRKKSSPSSTLDLFPRATLLSSPSVRLVAASSSDPAYLCSSCLTDHAEKLHQVPDEYFADVLPTAKQIALALNADNYNLLQVRRVTSIIKNVLTSLSVRITVALLTRRSIMSTSTSSLSLRLPTPKVSSWAGRHRNRPWMNSRSFTRRFCRSSD